MLDRTQLLLAYQYRKGDKKSQEESCFPKTAINFAVKENRYNDRQTFITEINRRNHLLIKDLIIWTFRGAN